eukprot:517194-Pyramimonas_sp.AAC.1
MAVPGYCLLSCDWFSRGVYSASLPAIGSYAGYIPPPLLRLVHHAGCAMASHVGSGVPGRELGCPGAVLRCVRVGCACGLWAPSQGSHVEGLGGVTQLRGIPAPFRAGPGPSTEVPRAAQAAGEVFGCAAGHEAARALRLELVEGEVGERLRDDAAAHM